MKVDCYETEDGIQYVPDETGALRSDTLISSVRVKTNPVHSTVKVWNRGGLAGSLTINTSDLDTLLCRLLGCTPPDLVTARAGTRPISAMVIRSSKGS